MILRLRQNILAIILFVFFFSLYVYTAVPGIHDGDSGELAAATNTLGLAHPTGFPLYILSAKLFTLLPIGEVAFEINIYSSLLIAFAIVFFFFTLRKLDASTTSSFLTSFVLGFGHTIWSHSGVTGVYSIAILFVSIFFFLFSKWLKEKTPKLLYWYAFLYGLSFGTHALMLSMVGSFIFMVWQSKRSATQKDFSLVKVVLLFLVPFLQYFYVPIAYGRNVIVNWGEINNIRDFINYITQMDYSDKIFTRSFDIVVLFTKKATELIISEFTILFFILAVLGTILLIKKNKKAVLLLSTVTLTNMGIMLMYGNNQDLIVLYRYLFPTYMVLSIVIAYLIDSVFKQTKNRLIIFLIFCALIAGLSWEFKSSYALNNRRNNFIISDFADNLLSSMENGSIIISSGDPITGPLWYMQSIGKRNDLIIISGDLIRYDWYIRNLNKRYPDVVNEDLLEQSGVGARLSEIIVTNLPTHKIYSIPNSIKGAEDFDFIPVGIVNRVTKKNVINKQEFLDLNMGLWNKYEMRGVESGRYEDVMVDEMTKYYALMLNNLGMAYFRSGLLKESTDMLNRSLEINPSSEVQQNLDLVQEVLQK